MAVNDFTTERTEAMIDPVTGEIIDRKDIAERLPAHAKEQGVSLVGPGGLLNQLTNSGNFGRSSSTQRRFPTHLLK